MQHRLVLEKPARQNSTGRDMRNARHAGPDQRVSVVSKLICWSRPAQVYKDPEDHVSRVRHPKRGVSRGALRCRVWSELSAKCHVMRWQSDCLAHTTQTSGAFFRHASKRACAYMRASALTPSLSVTRTRTQAGIHPHAQASNTLVHAHTHTQTRARMYAFALWPMKPRRWGRGAPTLLL